MRHFSQGAKQAFECEPAFRNCFSTVFPLTLPFLHQTDAKWSKQGENRRKKDISTSERCGQHPFAGLKIQHLRLVSALKL